MIVPRELGTPGTLYKYRQFDPEGNSLRLLDPGELWFSSARAFNDPFDSVLTYQTKETSKRVKQRWANEFMKRNFESLNRSVRRRLARNRIKEMSRDPDHHEWFEKKHIESVYKSLGIYCLSDVKDHLLMWAHYTDAHRGFCIGLDTERIRLLRENIFKSNGLMMLEKIRYEQEMPRINFYESMLDINKGFNDGLTLMLTKSNHWNYEKERRLIYWHHVDTAVRLLPGTITEVILGCRISEGNKRLVIKAAKTNWPNAQIFQAVKHERQFRLTFIEL